MSPAVFYSLEEARGRFGPCALAIGNFDGVHIGHQALIRKAAETARTLGIAPAALTFHPHPTVVVAPERVPKMLCTLTERVRLLHAAGAEKVLVLPFTPEIATLTPNGFVSQILAGALDTRAVFVGENFRFGAKQTGSAETLRALGQQFGFVSYAIEPVEYRGEIVSSSAIRRYVEQAKPVHAGRLLGRCFSMEAPVIPGRGIGSTQTVPTLNIAPPPELVVPRGVYVTETLETNTARRWQSITNAGVRPTFGGGEITIETFLLDPVEGAPPGRIRVTFRHFIRAERQFPNAVELRAQILKDVARAQTYWRRFEKLQKPAPSIY